MAMYYYASKISALACGTRCKRTVLQKARGQRDRDKCTQASRCGGYEERGDSDMCVMLAGDGVRLRRRHSDQALNVDEGGCRGAEDGLGGAGIVLDFQNLEVSTATSTKTAALTGYGAGDANSDGEIVEYDIPKNIFKRSHSDVNYENSVLGSGGIMYINGRIVSGPLESLIEVLLPENLYDLDKEFIFSFLLSSRLFLRPHELLGKLVSSVPDVGESLESLVALLAEWTNKFPYDYRDERMMSHVKHIVARCSNTRLEGLVSEILSALLKRLTDLERHEEDLRACQTHADQTTENSLECPTAPHYAQILCRLEKKLAKHVGPEEFLQCSSNVLLDKQKKWDQPSTAGGPPGAQDPKKTCNLETYLDWSARLRLFVCNEILQCSGIRDRSRTVELWSGVAQYCLLVGNYNSATAILETLESPPLARLKITWSKLTVTCQQLDCMQRHAEGHGDLWQKQAIVLNENQHHHQQRQQQHQQQQHEEEEHQKTETLTSAAAAAAAVLVSLTTSSTAATTTTADVGADVATMTTTTTTPTTSLSSASTTMTTSTTAETEAFALVALAEVNPVASAPAPSTTTTTATPTATATDDDDMDNVKKATSLPPTSASTLAGGVSTATATTTSTTKTTKTCTGTTTAVRGLTTTTTPTTTSSASASTKPNDWVVIPVFADIVKLALAGREDCLQRLPNGHINVGAFDRMAAIVGAFTKHMHTVKAATEAPSGGEYEMFCRHMQRTTKLNESELMMASFDCEEPNNAEKLMYDLN